MAHLLRPQQQSPSTETAVHLLWIAQHSRGPPAVRTLPRVSWSPLAASPTLTLARIVWVTPQGERAGTAPPAMLKLHMLRLANFMTAHKLHGKAACAQLVVTPNAPIRDCFPTTDIKHAAHTATGLGESLAPVNQAFAAAVARHRALQSVSHHLRWASRELLWYCRPDPPQSPPSPFASW